MILAGAANRCFLSACISRFCHTVPARKMSIENEIRSPMKTLENASSLRESPKKKAKLSPQKAAHIITGNHQTTEQLEDVENQKNAITKKMNIITEGSVTQSAATQLRFAKLTKNAIAPTKGSKLAAGYDLYSAYNCVVPAKGKSLIKTDIQIELPTGCYGRVAPRSGLAHKHFLDVGAGVIDEDYRGNVGVILFNFNDEDYKVSRGDRIAQLICERIYYPEIEEVDSLSETERAAGGYGSTGKN